MDTYTKGNQYELIVRHVYDTLLNQREARNIAVKHLELIQGTKSAYKIDVYWEFEIAGITYRTVVQAKDWNSRVKKDQVLTLKSVLDDIPGQPRGVIVTRVGLQKGAKELAEANGICIYVLAQAKRNPVKIRIDSIVKLEVVPVGTDHYFVATANEPQYDVIELSLDRL